MLSMNTMRDKFGSNAGILLDTQYVIEDFNLTWRIANFSQLFDTVHAEFSLKTNSTTWKLRLVDKRIIYLRRCDRGEPVNVDLKYCLVTRHKTFEGETFYKLLGGSGDVQIANLDAYEYDNSKDFRKIPIEFKNDIFEFCCSMKIVGPAVTKVVKSDDFLKPNLEKLSDDFKKLLKNRQHCDVTISTGNTKFPVHKAILCARSNVFDRMFQCDMLESKNQLIELDDLDSDTVKDFITFLYTDEVEMLSVSKVMCLYYVADKYEVEDLREKCSLYLEFNLNVHDACNVLKFAELHRDEKLRKAVTFFIQMHAAEVKLTSGWKDLSKEHPKIALEVLK